MKKILSLLLLLLCLMIPESSKAASLSANEFYAGGSITIYGSGFGSSYDTYSAVCFNDKSSCILGSNFYGSGYSWSDSTIKLFAPDWADVSGNIIVYGNGTKQECIQGVYSEYCYDTVVTVEKARLDYKISPLVHEVDNPVPRPGEKITISGNGFGKNGGSVYFGQYSGNIVSWSSDSIEVQVPSSISQVVKGVKVTSSNGLVSSYAGLTVSVDSSEDPFSNFQAEVFQTINLNKAWNITTGRKDVVVAVIDDGVYISHPDLQANIWTNKKESIGNNKDDDGNGFVDDYYGWDFIYNSPEMTTLGTHGTMVAGIIGAVGNNAEGISGVNWKVSLMPLIACNGDKGCPVAAIISAIHYATDNGADVINLSLGSQGVSAYSDVYNEAIRYAYDHGVTIVAAAGNGDLEGGIGQDTGFIPQSPVCNDNGRNMVLGVGATELDGEYRTAWSNYGKCVDIYAPGIGIASTSVPAYSSLGGFYDIESGTSFSAPLVSGVAALLKAKYPSMPNTEIISRIIRHNNAGVLDAFATLNEPYSFTPRTDGTLIRTTGSGGDIYLIKDGKKCLIPDYNVFIANGFKPTDVVDITVSEMSQYVVGNSISKPILEGALIRANNGIDVYIVKYVGSKKFKRLVLSPSVFNNYGHLKWENIMDIDQSIVDSFMTSELVRAVGDNSVYRLYPQGDTGQKRLVVSSEALSRLGLDPDSIYEINAFDRDSYITGTNLE